MREIALFGMALLTWFGYKQITALRRCAIKRNFNHPTLAAIFNFTVKLVGGSIITSALALGCVMAYNWDLTSQLVIRIMVNLFH